MQVREASFTEERQTKQRFGEALRRRRVELGVSQERAAAACGISRIYYTEVETGKRNVALLNIQKIAEGLGLTAADLLERAGL